MSRYISALLRNAVARRAGYCCEFCLLSEDDSVIPFEVDHAIPVKHKGPTVFENLAYICLICNRNKGSNVATADFPSIEVVRIFNPRHDVWNDHFELNDGEILPKTVIGRATVKVLDFNHVDRIMERRLLAESGSYPGKPRT